ncbi:hypothetical protein L6164_024133 [Bauhinia variegata]|nr:hypothetical protein L6164_024133 [Bauhinia variegata]
METKLLSLCEPHHFSPHLRFSTIKSTATIKILPRASKNGPQGSLKLGFRSISRLVACNSISGGSSSESLKIEKEDKEGGEGSVRPIYLPTPVNRELRTPHSG